MLGMIEQVRDIVIPSSFPAHVPMSMSTSMSMSMSMSIFIHIPIPQTRIWTSDNFACPVRKRRKNKPQMPKGRDGIQVKSQDTISPSPDSAVRPIPTLPSQQSPYIHIACAIQIHSPFLFPNISSIPSILIPHLHHQGNHSDPTVIHPRC